MSIVTNHYFKSAFLRRLARYTMIALGIDLGALLIGMLGYHLSEGLPWSNSLLYAAMILGGMGPVNELHTTAGKLFASFYALYSGVFFVAVSPQSSTASYTTFIWKRISHLEGLSDPKGRNQDPNELGRQIVQYLQADGFKIQFTTPFWAS